PQELRPGPPGLRRPQPRSTLRQPRQIQKRASGTEGRTGRPGRPDHPGCRQTPGSSQPSVERVTVKICRTGARKMRRLFLLDCFLLSPLQPFKPESCTPLIICFWKMTKTTSTGTMAQEEAVMIKCQAVVTSLEKKEMPTGMVRM